MFDDVLDVVLMAFLLSSLEGAFGGVLDGARRDVLGVLGDILDVVLGCVLASLPSV